MSEKFNSEMDQLSYAMGINMAQYLLGNPLQINIEQTIAGITDFINQKPKLDQEEYVAAMQILQQKMQAKGKEESQKIATENTQKEVEFLAENGKRDGVKTTASGLQYEVITEGKGKKPTSEDTVRVHYVGTLLNGVTFDSSVARNEPAEFGVGQVIPGWTEALQLMSVGSKYKLFIPAKIAYGERGAGQAIPPNATLVFEVELLDIV